MSILLYLFIVVLSFFAMEFVAWFTHKYIMHGVLWSWHESHHKPHENEGFFEKNDRFFLVFALPSAVAYMLSFTVPALFWLLFVGIGISVYGFVYFLVHDVYIHRRFKWFKKLDTPYSRAILLAHGAHHASQEKEDGESFGLLIVARKFYQARSQKELSA